MFRRWHRRQHPRGFNEIQRAWKDRGLILSLSKDEVRLPNGMVLPRQISTPRSRQFFDPFGQPGFRLYAIAISGRPKNIGLDTIVK